MIHFRSRKDPEIEFNCTFYMRDGKEFIDLSRGIPKSGGHWLFWQSCCCLCSFCWVSGWSGL